MNTMSILVTHKAPHFKCSAVLADGSLTDEYSSEQALSGKYGLVFFYPNDFTFVCPSELIALDRRIDALRSRNVEVIAVSIDSHFTHLAWRNTPVHEGGVGPLRFVMAGDIRHDICKAYGVEHGDGVALRAAFVIDREGVVRAQIVNDLPIGRNIDELIRLVDALQFHESHGEVCPAGWRQGSPGMKADPAGVAAYLRDHSEAL